MNNALTPSVTSASSQRYEIASTTKTNSENDAEKQKTRLRSQNWSSQGPGIVTLHQAPKHFLLKHTSWAKIMFLEALRHLFHQKTTFIVAGLSVFFVVFTSTLLSAISSYASVVTTRFAELQVGEVDVSISPRSSYHFFNFTEFADMIESNKALPSELGMDISKSFAPRMTFDALIRMVSCSSKTIAKEGGECEQRPEYTGETVNMNLMLYDHDMEKEARIGMFWPHPKLKKGEVYLTKRMSKLTNVSAGDRIGLSVEVGLLLEDILGTQGRQAQRELTFTVRVKEVLGSLRGKFPAVGSEGGGVVPNILGEFSHFIQDAVNSSPLTSAQKKAVQTYDLKHTVSLVVMRIPSRRTDAYYRTDFADVQKNVVQFSSSVLKKVRYNALNVGLPLLRKLDQYKFLSLFVGLVVQVIIVIFAILCFILLYSHLIYSVESRNAEMGILRLLGMQKCGVIHLTLAEVVIIAVPFWGFGVGIAQIVFHTLVSALGKAFGASLPKSIPSSSVWTSCIVGLLLPLLASLLPMQKALGTEPVEAFSWRRSKSTATKISIHRNNGRTPIGLLILASLGALYGFAIFNLFPKAIMELDMKALLYLFEVFILSILSGIVLCFTNFDLPIALFLKRSVFLLEGTGVHRISKMNLISHRMRNRKTFLMYSLSVTLVVYIQMSLNLQLETVLSIMRFHTGATFRVSSNSGSHREAFDCCRQKLEQLSDLPGVTSFSWVSESIHKTVLKDAAVSNLGGAFSTPFRAQAVIPTYLSATYKGTYRGPYKSRDSWNNTDVCEELYTIKGSQSVLVHNNMRKIIGLRGPGTAMAAKVIYKAKPPPDLPPENVAGLPADEEGSSLLSALEEYGGLPGFHTNKYSKHQASLVSFPTYTRLIGGRYPTIDKLPLAIFLLHVDTKRITRAQLRKIERALDNAKGSSLRVESIEDSAESVEAVSGLLQYGFLGINVLVMTVCLFALVTSMIANARENRKETAVLRAIGVREQVLFRSTFVEAFTLLMGANTVGTFTGWAVSQMQHYQQTLFLDLNSSVRTPWLTFTATLLASGVSSVIAAALSTRLGRHTIATDLCRV